MNEQDKKLYEQAEKYADVNFKGEGGGVWVEAFESKFADLIRADERKECAKLVVNLFDPADNVAEFIAEKILARGTT